MRPRKMDPEVWAIKQILKALRPFSREVQERVLRYALAWTEQSPKADAKAVG